MPVDTMTLWVGFGGLGITMLTVGVALAGLLVNLMNQQERRSEARMDRLEKQFAELIQQFVQAREETSRQFVQAREETSRQFVQAREETGGQFVQSREDTNRQLTEVNQRMDGMDGRLRGLEQGQAHLSGEFSALKDFFTHQPGEG